MFTENSGLVKTWVDLVNQKVYTRDQIPNLSNLKEVIISILDGGEN